MANHFGKKTQPSITNVENVFLNSNSYMFAFRLHKPIKRNPSCLSIERTILNLVSNSTKLFSIKILIYLHVCKCLKI